MTRTTGQPMWLGAAGVEVPKAIPVTSNLIDEAYIQDLLDRHPDLVPLDELSRWKGPLVSLGREIPTAVGPIDNLFINSDGDLVVVEAKLWRNPESRRKVVGQILDYASALSQLSYEQFDRIVASRIGGSSLWERVSSRSLQELDESSFVDAVTTNLRTGNFLLLIVGDGIKEDVENLSGLLGKHPNLGFHLELVELRIYEFESGERLVVPSILGQSREVTRAIVEVRTDVTGQVTVSVDALADEDDSPKEPFASIEAFVETVGALEPQSAPLLADLARWWEDEQDGQVRLNANSVVLLLADHGPKPGKAARTAVLWQNGDVEYPSLSLARRVGLASEESLDERARQHGFVGVKRLNRPDNRLVEADLESVRELIGWTADELRRHRAERDNAANAELAER